MWLPTLHLAKSMRAGIFNQYFDRAILGNVGQWTLYMLVYGEAMIFIVKHNIEFLK